MKPLRFLWYVQSYFSIIVQANDSIHTLYMHNIILTVAYLNFAKVYTLDYLL